MASGKQWAVRGAAIAVIVIASEILWLHHERNSGWTPANVVQGTTDPDDLVFLKRQRPSSLVDVKQLDGTTVWVSAGGQMDYYPYAAHHADYSKTSGTLLGAEPMIIRDVFEQVAPKSVTLRVPSGDKQVLLAFTMPKSADPAKEYAVPVGYRKDGDYTFITDDIFFYTDPHELYKHWGPQVWQAVDSHQVLMGMNNRQVQLSLGQIFKSDSQDFANGTSVFFNLGKPIAVTFVKDRVTGFRPDQGY